MNQLPRLSADVLDSPTTVEDILHQEAVQLMEEVVDEEAISEQPVTQLDIEAEDTLFVDEAEVHEHVSSTAETDTTTTPSMLPPQHTMSHDRPDVVLEQIPSLRAQTTMPAFHALLALWCSTVGISRTQYSALLEILRTLKDITPITDLPNDITTLKKTLHGQIDTLPVLRRKIPVVAAKLPTLSLSERKLYDSSMRYIYLIDPVALLVRLVQSPQFQSKMYHGMAQFVEKPTELWQSLSWETSIRATSGQFALFPDKTPVFPSDFVYYCCDNAECCSKVPEPKKH